MRIKRNRVTEPTIICNSLVSSVLLKDAYEWSLTYKTLLSIPKSAGRKFEVAEDKEYAALCYVLYDILGWFLQFKTLDIAKQELHSWIKELLENEEERYHIVGHALKRCEEDLEWKHNLKYKLKGV